LIDALVHGHVHSDVAAAAFRVAVSDDIVGAITSPIRALVGQRVPHRILAGIPRVLLRRAAASAAANDKRTCQHSREERLTH
jgi:hypothetical protein